MTPTKLSPNWIRRKRAVIAAAFILVLICSVLAAQESSDKTAQSTDNDTVYDLRNAHENGITAPKAVYHPDPEYTDRARKKKTRGTVVLSMIVTPQGNVRELQIIQSLDKELDKQALNAVSKWKFEPATKDGQPVAVRIRTEISFNLY